jgi:glutathione peroxidase
MRVSRIIAAIAALTFAAMGTRALAGTHPPQGGKPMTKGIFEFDVKTADGGDRHLADYKGKALLIVNSASKCGFTPQYKSLETLYEKYKARGFEVLAFPANNFGAQEPGTNDEIQTFCAVNYHTTFPVFAKISVKGKDISPLYSYLTKDSPFPGEIGWNFAKFLVAPDGRIVARFKPDTDPLAKDVTSQLEAILPVVR